MAGSGAAIDLGGRQVRLTNLTKVMYPATGMTKAGVVDYYRRVAPAILDQLRGRPVTRVRFPEGVDGERFFEKNVPAGAPDWLRRATLPASPGTEDEGTELDAPVPRRPRRPGVGGEPGLAGAAHAAVAGRPTGRDHEPRPAGDRPGPGAPAGLAECARVALLVAERLDAEGLQAAPVTSGGKGMQLYVPLNGSRTATQVREQARTLAEELARAHPRLVVAIMRKDLRRGRVLLDWSQNHPAKTTITPYSLRGQPRATVAAPRTWDEIEEGAEDELGLEQWRFDQVLDRVADLGDLFAD